MHALVKTFTIEDIKTWAACEGTPKSLEISNVVLRALPLEWRGTAIDILSNSSISDTDAGWVVHRSEVLEEALAKRYAAWRLAENVTGIKHPCEKDTVVAAAKYISGSIPWEQFASTATVLWAINERARSASRSKLLAMLKQEQDITISDFTSPYAKV